MNNSELEILVNELSALSTEAEWVEFKHNKANTQEIGENISAISNATALLGKPVGYILWGVDDISHEIVGTDFKPRQTKIGNEELENWLLKLLSPSIDLRIYEHTVNDKRIVLFEVKPAPNSPVRFNGNEYIRVGSYTKKLSDFREKERSLWRIFDKETFEDGITKSSVSSDEVLSLLDYPGYFELTEQPLPDNRAAILERLESDNIIFSAHSDRYNITNIGAILFAKDLNAFDRLSRKALRVVTYSGQNRVEATREIKGGKGYACGFIGAIRYINDQLPQNEEIGQALRHEVKMYPEIAVRELVANALIHQDFNISGAGPMVEIFSNRMEITNPGIPLINVLRFIDEPPRSRNEKLAGLMRRMAICEERGSGIDKVIFHVESFQLPPPDFRATNESTVIVLYGPRKFSQMDRAERIRACYHHASLLFVSGERMTNSSLRKRLGIKDTNYPQASKIIRESIDSELIKPYGRGKGSAKDSSYLPFWA